MKILNSCLVIIIAFQNPHTVNARLCCVAATLQTIEIRALIVSNISLRYKITLILPMRLSYMRLMLSTIGVGTTGYINALFRYGEYKPLKETMIISPLNSTRSFPLIGNNFSAERT